MQFRNLTQLDEKVIGERPTITSQYELYQRCSNSPMYYYLNETSCMEMLQAYILIMDGFFVILAATWSSIWKCNSVALGELG